MIKRMILFLTFVFLKRGWICKEDVPHCGYALECLIIKVAFFILLSITCAALCCYKEALIFSVVLFSFRKRMGGWHSQNPWFCQFLSLGLVILNATVFGPQSASLRLSSIIGIDFVLIIISFYLPPAFPPQLHFTHKEVEANIHKKNNMITILFFVQAFFVLLGFPSVLIYSSLGLLFGIVSVLAQIVLIFMERKKYEND